MLRSLFPRRLLQWLGPLLAAGVAAFMVAAIVVVSGVFDLAATTPHPVGWSDFLHFVFRRSVAYHADDLVPPADTHSPSRIALGAAHYANVCANCHGAPGIGQNPNMLSMTPRPPYLPIQIKRYAPGAKGDAEIFWVLKHGVKYSAMPGWPAQLRDDEIWSMVGFVRTLPDLKYDVYRRVAFGETGTPAPAAPRLDFGGEPVERPYAIHNSTIYQGNVNRYFTPAWGPGEFAQTGDVIATCARCHGVNGTGRVVGAFPNIAIQTPAYVRSALLAFASGKRQSAYMQTVAAQLSPAQIDSVARYYASQPKAKSLAAAVRPLPASEITVGRQLAEYGDRARGLGACSGCHALTEDDQRVYPRLRGQNADYMIAQMKLFAAGGRGAVGNYNPMAKIAGALTPREIEAVSAYYAAATPTDAAVAPADLHLVKPQR